MNTHEHNFVKQDEFSCNSIDRFLCECGQWAFRLYPPGNKNKNVVQPIVEYKNGFNSEKYRSLSYETNSRHARAMAVRDRQSIAKWREGKE